MAILIGLKRRIRITKNIAKTTRAMQMVAASKMRKAQDAALAGRPYQERLGRVVGNLAGRVSQDYSHPFLVKQKRGGTLLIVVSPDKGLCGALVSNLLRMLLSQNYQLVLTIGKKLARKTTGNIIADFPMGLAEPNFLQILPISVLIKEGFLSGEFSDVNILYAKFTSIFSQVAVVEKILPIEIAEREEKKLQSLYLFEPSPEEILNSLLPHYLESRLYHLLLEAYASEQSARMIAMQNATENAIEAMEVLTLEYNKARQEKITSEILDNARASVALLGAE